MYLKLFETGRCIPEKEMLLSALVLQKNQEVRKDFCIVIAQK